MGASKFRFIHISKDFHESLEFRIPLNCKIDFIENEDSFNESDTSFCNLFSQCKLGGVKE